MTTETLTQNNKLTKTKSHAFGKDVYLLGRDQYGEPVWLEAAKWDCGWYWGFGYIETYTRKLDPANSRDIDSHRHWSGFVGKQDNGEYLHHINQALTESVLTESESLEISDLVKSTYTLKEAAEVLGRGGSHLTEKGNRDCIKSQDMVKQINEVMLPALFQEIYKILEG